MAAVVGADDVLAIPHFRALGAREASVVAPLLRLVRLEAHALLWREGEPGERFCYVRTGTLRLFRTGGDGREQTLRIASAGETLGEVPAFDDGPNPVSVEALEPTEVVVVPSAVARVLVERYPAVAQALLRHFARRLRAFTDLVAQALLRHFARRLRAFTDLVEQLSLQTVQQRLARYLYLEARACDPGEGMEIAVERRLTGQELASLLGSVREVVARTLKTFEDEGVIVVERHRYVIRDMEALRRML